MDWLAFWVTMTIVFGIWASIVVGVFAYRSSKKEADKE